MKLVGAYPRWLGLAKIGNEANKTTRALETVVVIGDSKLENEIGVAKGFPNATLGPDDVIISKVFADYFGLSKAVGSNLQLTINLDSILNAVGIDS